MFELFQRSMR